MTNARAVTASQVIDMAMSIKGDYDTPYVDYQSWPSALILQMFGISTKARRPYDNRYDPILAMLGRHIGLPDVVIQSQIIAHYDKTTRQVSLPQFDELVDYSTALAVVTHEVCHYVSGGMLNLGLRYNAEECVAESATAEITWALSGVDRSEQSAKYIRGYLANCNIAEAKLYAQTIVHAVLTGAL